MLVSFVTATTALQHNTYHRMCKVERSGFLKERNGTRLFRHSIIKSLAPIVMAMLVCSIFLFRKISGMEKALPTAHKLMAFNMVFFGGENGNFAIISLANLISQSIKRPYFWHLPKVNLPIKM